MRNKINLMGIKDINKFVDICMKINGKIELFCPKNGYRVNAKSLLGVLATTDWEDTWIDSEKDIYFEIERWVVLGEDSGNIHN